MEKNIAVLPGDGIGDEVMAEAIRVLDVVAEKFGHKLNFSFGLVGGAAWDKHKSHFPKETEKLCRANDAILFGSVGGPVGDTSEKWNTCIEESILVLRKLFQFNANFRPVKVYPELADLCPLKEEIIGDGIDMLFVRELVGGIYFGEHKDFERNGKRAAHDVCDYDEEQIASVAHLAFQAAAKRSKKVTSVEKSNVLSTSKLWRTVVREIAKSYPDIELEEMLVDNCAMQIISNPKRFDVILTGNMFGDILSDAAAVLPGSLGLIASAGLNAEGFGYYEPPGGSAQDIAGKGIANPIAQILTAAMMLKYSFSLVEEADAIEQAVEKALKGGARTADISGASSESISTSEMTDRVIACL